MHGMDEKYFKRIIINAMWTKIFMATEGKLNDNCGKIRKNTVNYKKNRKKGHDKKAPYEAEILKTDILRI